MSRRPPILNTGAPSRRRRFNFDALLEKPPHRGGPIRDINPSAKRLVNLVPPGDAVPIHSGLVRRGDRHWNAAMGLPGFRWQIPAPDPNWKVLWASLAFDWAFWSWRDPSWPKNDGDKPIRVEGSVDWFWFLTGHWQFFNGAPIFLSNGGHYSFYTSVSPGAEGWDAGWLDRPIRGVYSAIPDKEDASLTSPLQRLLAMNVNGNLELWFAFGLRNQRGPGNLWQYGPETLYYTYAYTVPADQLPTPPSEPPVGPG